MRAFMAARCRRGGAFVLVAAAVFVAATCFQSCSGGGGGGGGLALTVTQPGLPPTPLPQAAPGQGTSGPLTIIPGVTITRVCRPDAAKPREVHIKGSGLTASIIGNVIEGTSSRPVEVLSVAQDGREALVRLPETSSNQIELKLVVTDGKILVLSFDLSTVPACPRAGVTLTPMSGLVTTELGGQASFTIVLDREPTADVTIALSSSDSTEGSISPASVTFTSADWNAPRTVTITGLDDGVVDGDQPYSIVTAPAVRADTSYAGLDPADVAVSNTDNGIVPSGDLDGDGRPSNRYQHRLRGGSRQPASEHRRPRNRNALREEGVSKSVGCEIGVAG